jgi:hypothetical protein
MAEKLDSSTSPTPSGPSPERHFAMGSLIIVPSLLLGVTVGQQGSATPATPAAATAPAVPADPAPAVAAASGSTTLKSDLEDLSAQIKKLHGQVDGLPQPEPAPDLKPLEAKIEELSKLITSARPLVEEVDKLGVRIGDVGKRIESFQGEVASLVHRKSEK